MEGRVCWLCGAGEFTPRFLSPCPGDIVVAADGGLAYLQGLHIQPTHILGDFDSLGYLPQGENVEAHPPEKDDTDLLLGVRYGLTQGCDTFLIYGGLGGRLSHTVANLQVLRFLCARRCHGALVGEGCVVTMLENEVLRFPAGCAGMLSLFAQDGAAEGVTLKNLKYCVENATLTGGYPLGVSNEFIGAAAQVQVKRGALLAIWEGADADPTALRFSSL